MNTKPPDKKDDDNWEDEALDDQRKSSMTVDAARKILAVNPTLRAKGADTNFIMKQSGQRADTPKTKAPEEKKEGELAAAKDPDHLFELATQGFHQEKRSLESEISILQAKLSGLKGRYCKAVMEKMATLDRNLTSPMTQAAMQQHKAIITELGFTPQKFMEHLRSKR